MTPKRERWAEALSIVNRYGDHCFAHVAERIGALALSDDAAGVRRWREIATCIDKMTTGTIH